MTWNYIYKVYREQLSAVYSPGEIRGIFGNLLRYIANKDLIYIQLHPNEIPGRDTEKKFSSALRRLLDGEPVQYITGFAYFAGMDLHVDKHTLIPRPETAELVEWIRSSLPAVTPLNILDVGTGSGCIAIALAKYFPDAVVTATDISPEALTLARKNAELHNTDIRFLLHDITGDKQISGEKFQLIVSNPPYITPDDKHSVPANVLEHEPHTALFTPAGDPLYYYRHTVVFATRHLAGNGSIYFETNEAYAHRVKQLLEENGYRTELRKDFLDKERFVRGTK